MKKERGGFEYVAGWDKRTELREEGGGGERRIGGDEMRVERQGERHVRRAPRVKKL